MKAWWAARDLRTKILLVAAVVALIIVGQVTNGGTPKAKPVATKPARPVATAAAPVKCTAGTHLTKLGWCLSNKPPAIQITAADREAAAVQNDATVCAGDAGCAVARPLKRKLTASGAAVQSMTCINDVGTHLKCLATLKDGSAASYDVTVDPSTGQFIYQLSP